MEPFTTHTGLIAPLNRLNVDTDQIIPKQYLKTIHRTGLKEGLFADWRETSEGSPDPDFFTNQPLYQQATILLTGENFGCGSSREHAPWALLDYGFRCILALSFADIFYNNCFQNGILPVTLPPQDIQLLFDRENGRKPYSVTVNLTEQRVILPEGEDLSFEIDPFRKDCLLKGLDAIGLTLQRQEAIQAYETRRRAEAPWLFQDLTS